MMKLLKMASVVLVLVLAGAFTQVQAQKFGYINSSELLAELPEVKSAEAELTALQTQLRKKGQSMVEQLQTDYLAVQQKVERGELSPKQQEEEAAKLEARQNEIAKFEQDMSKQMQDKRQQLLQPIYDKVNKAIEDVAKENGMTFVFDKQVLLYSEATQDVGPMVKQKLGI
jgi:outer membrane protein